MDAKLSLRGGRLDMMLDIESILTKAAQCYHHIHTGMCEGLMSRSPLCQTLSKVLDMSK